ncbi:hypothetical protein GALMADRAFT_223097 [Galerina marginata CBS 339.88]|uniref:Uncharacterized protein n=1 Tax=Galerina marginata (strain CBS 339.88) TaxID=685588 RepID=A0A067TAG3_GALM3|nr:hypothetical protein GALMADRAFT_223097 [Galerina marginata CBS 339.88]
MAFLFLFSARVLRGYPCCSRATWPQSHLLSFRARLIDVTAGDETGLSIFLFTEARIMALTAFALSTPNLSSPGLPNDLT